MFERFTWELRATLLGNQACKARNARARNADARDARKAPARARARDARKARALDAGSTPARQLAAPRTLPAPHRKSPGLVPRG